MSLAVIKTIFREGVSRGLIEESPADGVKTPGIQVIPRKFMTIEELERADFGRYKPQVMFLAYHGLRWSEAMALTEADIRDGRVYISKSIHGQTKTKSGVRSVPLMSPYIPLPKSPKTLRKVCHENGIHIHSLRHTYAYLLKTSGVHVTTAQQLLGHSDPKVTLGVYTGFRESEIDEARTLMQNYISR
jgi:integrase